MTEGGKFPKDEEIKIEPQETKAVVERWSSLRELYDEMRETAALWTPKNSTNGSNV